MINVNNSGISNVSFEDMGDGAYLLSYEDCGYDRKQVYLDWASFSANYEQRLEDAGEPLAQGYQDEK